LGINLSNEDHQELLFKSNEYRIGRCLGLELCLRNVNISRLHCIFTKGETGWSVTCKSSNGVRVNGKKMEQDTESPLKHGDTIRLADQEIYYWKFVQIVDLTQNENVEDIKEDENEPASKKMRLMEVGLESMSQHIFEAAKEGLDKKIDSRRRAAEDWLLSVNAALKESVSEGDTKGKEEKEVMFERMTRERAELEETMEKERQEIEMQLKQLQKRLDKENSSTEKIENEFRVMVDKIKNEQNAKLNNDKKKWIEMEKVIAHEKREKERLAKEVKELKEGFEVERSKHTAQMKTIREEKEKKEEEYHASMREIQQRDKKLMEEYGIKLKDMIKKQEEINQEIVAERLSNAATSDESYERSKKIADLEDKLIKNKNELSETKARASKMAENDARKARLEVLDQMENTVEAQFMCPTCMESFINPVVLNCGHTYCWLCLSQWKKSIDVPTCPECRTVIKNENKALIINNMIDATMASLGQEKIAERNDKVAARKVLEAEFQRIEEAARAQNLTQPEVITIRARLHPNFVQASLRAPNPHHLAPMQMRPLPGQAAMRPLHDQAATRPGFPGQRGRGHFNPNHGAVRHHHPNQRPPPRRPNQNHDRRENNPGDYRSYERHGEDSVLRGTPPWNGGRGRGRRDWERDDRRWGNHYEDRRDGSRSGDRYGGGGRRQNRNNGGRYY